MRKALLSVSDKTGIIPFAKSLTELDFELYSTGGTKKALEENNIPVKSVSDLTQFPEIMDGRVKTLHPNIHGGILADRSNPEHVKAMETHDIAPLDLVVVNLYPFEATVANPDVTEMDAIENIDIGGPTMLRSSAKNFKHVITVVDPSDYDVVIEKLKADTLDEAFRKQLMIKVFTHTNKYDAAIVNFFSDNTSTLRYGENPHQKARFIKTDAKPNTLAGARVLHGKPLSFNNIKDADATLFLVKQFDMPAAVAVKHMNPCGVGTGEVISEAFQNAYDADSQSIFGGIVALNREVDKATAEKMHAIFLEVIIAPKFSDEALEILTAKKNIRLLEIDMDTDKDEEEFVSVSGGYLVQDKDLLNVTRNDMRVVTNTEPTEAQWKAIELGWKVVKSVKSNAIVLANDKQTVGIGAGQMNRVGAAKIAIERAIEMNDNVVLASDGFFPMSDTVETAYAAGIKCIVQPGGSIKDQDSIDKANEYGIAMVMTDVRHFKH
ncbi:bifunctional phosphoribosylaminoimidazolecarboxamide formyltransferase/IMP cyclohydrolase [Macrococcoides caseolyticum]|uniref:Bifunctional phosphoribosylaminoimidazolecarboxamide formyltransferase/inosine monophosphate cyclohydrolase n=1 Tax=Macrococcoides caseolyticum TaxID=69966 RepID=A0ACC9MVF1_9STAP|nr:bifunctional phosphoribosylaminoimidazolecarboxamide formyltransferase/IMP cyclohydrolase [Macrococcus caseolyticus]PKE20313.1 bifunctional phosphoribosylaminoimidazolecarboxamide formyltransferase/inosine monophosphate cyclohydrolase [Macrococcus caseolyticus]PKE40282.1 bifunctional phosphoribosylaminoimidazolecarboxamide formyltransferase/inosine monophosphate cyclohydrolase [Macrococcus caseolyticus]PKE57450.1 bifunctional phosphoribosylaminoimidazolecarboxamide formyltransferase/inosine m